MKNNAYKRLKMDDCAGKQLLSVSLRNYLRVKEMYCIFVKWKPHPTRVNIFKVGGCLTVKN